MAPRRKIGPVERGVRRDLRTFPDIVARGSVAESMITLAQEADSSALAARDLATVLRELRLCFAQLHDIAPPGAEGDQIDELSRRREERLLRDHGQDG